MQLTAATRKKTKRLGWSAAEDDALLRAWADVVARSAKSLSKAFATTCAAAAVPQERTTTSLSQRRAQYVRMYEIVLAFHKSRQQQQQTKSAMHDSSAHGALYTACCSPGTAEYSSDSWFELPTKEQRRWFASLNTGTATFGEMTQTTFDRVKAILKCQDSTIDTQLRRESRYVEGSRSTTDLRTSIANLKGGVRCRSDKGVPVAAAATSDVFYGESNQETAAVRENDDSSSGSSTESDDEVLLWSGERGEAASQRPVHGPLVKEEGRPGHNIKTQSALFVKDSEQQQQPTSRHVDPDFLELASILETQSRHLSNLFRQTKQRRYEESRGRQYLWKKTRLDDSERGRVLRDIARRNQELQREREDWGKERRAMQHEMTRLSERKALRKPPPAEVAPSSSTGVVTAE